MLLPTPKFDDVERWVREHLGDLCGDEVRASGSFRGGQAAADVALDRFHVGGYAARRNEVWPEHRRGASRLSPYIRHGLLPLGRVWHAVEGGPARDVTKFRDELLWQEYARHLYARIGSASGDWFRHRVESHTRWEQEPWWREMKCVDLPVSELLDDGWMVNQARMWMASQWSVRAGAHWRVGEDAFFRHLLDGSRAANRLGWQWTIGGGTGSAYGFSRRQVEKRAPGLCSQCPLHDRCPIEDWPPSPAIERLPEPPGLRDDADPTATGGPRAPVRSDDPEVVWLTAESMGDGDPALMANPDLPVVFVFDETLLEKLRLSGKRLVFMAETLADLATRRTVEIHRGQPEREIEARRPAVTFAPVPGFRRLHARLSLAEVHPWPWLRRPAGGPVTSFTAWRTHTDR